MHPTKNPAYRDPAWAGPLLAPDPDAPPEHPVLSRTLDLLRHRVEAHLQRADSIEARRAYELVASDIATAQAVYAEDHRTWAQLRDDLASAFRTVVREEIKAARDFPW